MEGKRKRTFVFVTGGVISGIGKGITASSLGLLYQNEGLRVTAVKIDPYLNVDAGNLSPYEHGECYILKDGHEADLDLGNYERFLKTDLTRKNCITSGSILLDVLHKERKGEYNGETVQLYPHVSDEVRKKLMNSIEGFDICIVEIGGTIDDAENAPFMYAVRDMMKDEKVSAKLVHVACLIEIGGESKTRPAQSSIAKLLSKGLTPDLLVLRSKEQPDKSVYKKIEMQCGISADKIISNPDVPNIYYVPLVFHKQNILNLLGFDKKMCDLPKHYLDILEFFKKRNESASLSILKRNAINIGIVCKYLGSPDTYLSLTRAIEHASFLYATDLIIPKFIDSESDFSLEGISACIIPGGFGTRGIRGKINAASRAFDKSIPTLGICLGMHAMILAHMGLYGSPENLSRELNGEAINPVMDYIHADKNMNVGERVICIEKDSDALRIYNDKMYIAERFRHRYGLSNDWIENIETEGGFFVSGKIYEPWKEDDVKGIPCIIEHNSRDFYVGCQFHPEYRTRYDKPHPLFVSLVEHAKAYDRDYKNSYSDIYHYL